MICLSFRTLFVYDRRSFNWNDWISINFQFASKQSAWFRSHFHWRQFWTLIFEFFFLSLCMVRFSNSRLFVRFGFVLYAKLIPQLWSLSSLVVVFLFFFRFWFDAYRIYYNTKSARFMWPAVQKKEHYSLLNHSRLFWNVCVCVRRRFFSILHFFSWTDEQKISRHRWKSH